MLRQFVGLDRERCTRIDELCREYENAWYREVEPSLASFVERVPLEDRLDCLRELLATDFELRINEQREIPIAELLTQFPEHTDLISDIYREVIETAVPIPKPVPKSALMGTLIGDYRLVREIGRGGMGVVYEAIHETLQRTVALKVLPAGHEFDQNRISRFAREARAIARLHHEHIVEVYGAGQVDGTHFIAMQFIAGESLDRLLVRAEHRREFVESTFGKSGSSARPSKSVSGKVLGEASSLTLRVGHSASELPDSESQATRKPSGDCALGDSGNQQAAFAETVIQPVAQAAGLSQRSTSEGKAIQGQAGEPPALRPDFNFAPELGKTFADRCRKVAEIGQQMAEALSYAHSHGVLHRDLKPANVLLDQLGHAWLTDFGLAKVAEASTALTESGNIVGTIKYLAPEALNGQTDERSDLYSLGLTLYELLSGHTAFDAPDQAKLLQAILHSEPTRLSELLPSAPRDLVTIIHKSIDREPSGRYQTAQELAEDLQRFLHDESIRGRELSHSERFARWAKRNKLLATLLISMGVIVTVVAISSTIAAGYFQQLNSKLGQSVNDLTTKTNELTEKSNQLTVARNKAQEDAAENQRLARAAELARQGAQSTLADMQTERGFLASREKQPAVAALWFANAATLTPHDPDRQRANHLRAASWLDEGLVPAASLMTPGCNWDQVFCQPGGSLLLAVGRGQLRVWDWRNNLVVPWSEELTGVGEAQAQWSPDGRHLAVGSSTGEVRLLEPVSGKVWKQFRHPEQARVLKWSPQGTRLAVGDKRVQVWNVADEPKLEFDWPHLQGVYGLNFNRVGTHLISACTDKTAHLFALDGAADSAKIFEHAPLNLELRATPVFCNGDRQLVTFLADPQHAALWDVTTGQRVNNAWGVAGPSHLSLDASADGKRVLAGGYMGCLLLGVDGSHLTVDHGNHVFNVKFHPNGQSFATACYDGKSRLWSVRDPLAVSPPVFIPQFGTITGVVFSEDGSKLVGYGQNHVVVWERAPQSAIVGKLAWKESSWRPRPSFDGRFVAPGVWHFGISSPSPRGNTLSVMRMNDGQPAGPTIALDGLQVDSCVCSDNRSVAVITAKGTTGLLSIFDVASGKLLVPTVTFPEVPLSMAARPEHSDVAVLCPDGSLRVIDSTTGSTRLTLSHDSPAGNAITAQVVYTPDGQTLVTLLSKHRVYARDVDSGELRFPPINPITQDEDCRAITLSKDSRLLATVVAGTKNLAQVWDLATGQPAGTSMPHPGDEFGLWAVAFSPDAQRLVTGHKDGQARIWDWRTGQLVGNPMQHPGEIYDICFTVDGRHLVTCVRANSLHVWDVATGKLAVPLMPELLPPGGSTECTAITANRIVACSSNWYSLIDLSRLAQKSTIELPDLLARAELATNQKLHSGKLLPLGQEEWGKRLEQVVAPRHTLNAAAESLAREFAAATTGPARQFVVARAMRANQLELLQKLRPDDLQLRLFAAAELLRVGDKVRLKPLLPMAISAARTLLKMQPGDEEIQTQLAKLLAEELPSPTWSPLQMMGLKAESGRSFTRLSDGSVLAKALADATSDSYVVRCRSPLRRVTAVRLDTRPHHLIPDHPQPWAETNFALTEVRAELHRADGSKLLLKFKAAVSDHVRAIEQYMTSLDGPWAAIDGTRSTGWDVWPATDVPHWLALEFDQPVDIADTDELVVSLDSGDVNNPTARLGCFRLSVTADELVCNRHLCRTALQAGGLSPAESLAMVNLARGDAAEAIVVFRSAKERSGQNDLNPKPSPTERPFAERKATMADSPITLLLLAKAHHQRGETDAAKAVLKDLIETLQQQPLPRLLHGPFLEVASEIAGHARYEFATLLAPPSEREQLVPSGLHMFCWRLVGLGEWQAASQVALLEVAATPSNRSFWQHAAPLLVLVHDEVGYRDLCQRMLQYIDKLPPPTPEQLHSRAESICKVTSLMPSELNRPLLPVKPLIEFVDKNPNEANLVSWYCAALSLTTYRDGDFKPSAIWAEKSLTHSQRKGDAGALALVVLSMAQHQLKDPKAARKSLSEATALIPASLAIDGRQPIPGPFPVPTAAISGDWLIAEALRREASLLIHQKSQR